MQVNDRCRPRPTVGFVGWQRNSRSMPPAAYGFSPNPAGSDPIVAVVEIVEGDPVVALEPAAADIIDSPWK